MCIEDLAIARRTYTKRTSLSAFTVTRFKADPYRLSLTLSYEFANPSNGVIAITEADATANSGIVTAFSLVPGTNDNYSMIDLTVEIGKHRGIVQGELYVKTSSATAYVVEVLMMEDLAKEVAEYVADKRRKHHA